jgi:hypothetical protein
MARTARRGEPVDQETEVRARSSRSRCLRSPASHFSTGSRHQEAPTSGPDGRTDSHPVTGAGASRHDHFSSYPRSVREEIERHRQAIDENPVLALQHGRSESDKVTAATAEYLEGSPQEVALTDSTTMGLALIYHGLPLRAGQEVLTTGTTTTHTMSPSA